MKPTCKTLATALAALLALSAARAAVPIAWTNAPGMPPHMPPPVPHGSTVELSVTLRGYTSPPIAPGADVRLWYQTNGMGAAWFSAPATISGNVITSTFGPRQDTGADRVILFFGAPSNVFASAVLRLTHAPGFTPAAIEFPRQTLDFSAIELHNISALTNGWSFGSATDLTPATNYTDRALSFFSATGTVFRSASYGTPTRWTDATGCVWEVSDMWSLQNGFLLYTQTGPNSWVASGTEWDSDYSVYYGYGFWYDTSNGRWVANTDIPENPDVPAAGQPTDTVVSVDGFGTFRRFALTNLVGRVAYTNDLPSTNGFLMAESDPTVPDWAKESSPPSYTAADVGAAPTSIVPVLASVSNDAVTAKLNADTALRIVLGESVWFAVTNYMRTAQGVIPSLQLWEVRGGATNLVYDSREEITNTVRALTQELRDDMTNRIHGVSNAIPSKAWGNYQSDGADNPQPGEVAIINQPTVILTGGGTFNKYLTVGDSSVWVLKASGPVSFGGDTNGNFLAVIDDDGREHFKVAKTDSYDLPAIVNDILPRQHMNSVLLYTATTNRHGNAVQAHPILTATDDLKESAWHEESEGEIDALGLTVSWTRDDTIPAWVATITQDVWHPKLFLRAKVSQEGGVAVINTAPARFDGGVKIRDTIYSLVPYTTGGKTYMTLEPIP